MAGSDLPAELQVQVTQRFRPFSAERDALWGETGSASQLGLFCVPVDTPPSGA